MKISTWNSNGLNQLKADWLLTYLKTNSDVVVFALQETHCQDDNAFPQAIKDIKLNYTVIHSPPIDGDTYAGIMLIISKEFKIETQQIVIDGRVMYVRLESVIYGSNLDVVVVYGYPSGRQPYIKQVTDAIDPLTPTVLLGDFNYVTDPKDRSDNIMNDYDKAQANISNPVFEALGLDDAFRLRHGDKIDYSFKRQSESRIDRIYVNEPLQGKIKDCKYKQVLGRERDHRMVEVNVIEEIELGKGYWKFNTSLLRDDIYTQLIKGTIAEAKLELNNGEWDNIEEWWEYLKMLLRTVTIDYCKDKEEKRKDYMAVLYRKITILENDLFYNIDKEKTETELSEVKKQIEKEEQRKAEGHRIRARVPNFETEEGNIAYLSQMEKWQSGRNLIYALKDNQDNIKLGTQNVLNIAHEFYKDLFTSQPMDEQAQNEILSKLDKQVPEPLKIKFEQEITIEELTDSVRKMANGKSPGSDGFPAEFWKFFWKDIENEFKSLVDWIYTTGKLTNSMSGAIIRLLYKKGDRLDVKNYRPISLINADYKIISKSIATRMSSVLPHIIDMDQTCVPGRKISDNLHVLRDVVQYCNGNNIDGALLFLDQEKCFDRVEHSFMLKVMQQMGYGNNFIKWVSIFYNQVFSRVLINGTMSDLIPIGRGTRQGDAPSSLIYVMVAEVLACQIRKNTEIKGISIDGVEKKIGGYADDTQCFVSKVESLGPLLGEIRLFERSSGAKLNQQKTEGLWLGTWRGRPDKPYGFTWKSTRIKVLGVWIGESSVKFANYEDRYSAILAKLRTWSHQPLSSLGKVRVANIFLYSRLWYQTEISQPLSKCNQSEGFENVERQVASWVFRGRQEVSAARLKDAYRHGGAQLVDIRDKVRTQRVGWLSRLLAMPERAFPRVLAGAIIGKQNYGYYGLDVLTADLTQMNLKPHAASMSPGGFYWEAIKAWSSMSEELSLAPGHLHNDHIFFNPQILNQNGETYKPARHKWMQTRDILKVDKAKAISGLGLKRDQWFELVALRERIPDLPHTSNPTFLFKTTTEPKELHRVPFRDIYASFRSKTKEPRHFEEKWKNTLGIDIGEQWEEVWKGLHATKCSLKVKTNIWRQINLNFWTAYMDHAYIGRGDGKCCLCNEIVRNRWHVITECDIVKKLWQKLLTMVAPLGGTTVIDTHEMAFGLKGTDKRTKL